MRTLNEIESLSVNGGYAEPQICPPRPGTIVSVTPTIPEICPPRPEPVIPAVPQICPPRPI
jgi:hypothetical protein